MLAFHTVAIIDRKSDENLLAAAFRSAGFSNLVTFSGLDEFERYIASNPCSIVIIESSSVTGDIATYLGRMRARNPCVAVTVLCEDDSSLKSEIAATAPACDYVSKSTSLENLISDVKGRLVHAPIVSPNSAANDVFTRIVTKNPRMLEIFRYIQAIGCSQEPLLITGDTGTGKDLIAQSVHSLSRVPGEFVAVNVAGYDDTMFADSLFGHRKGAFTGANEQRTGLVLRADEGTLFLDEIGDLSITSQVKLLRLLQEREYFPLGSDTPKYTTARIVVATSQDLRRLQLSGTFRKDLFYRLRTHHVHLPPLHERPEDIELLSAHFVRETSRSLGRLAPAIPAEFLDLLRGRQFSGNVRELRGIIYDIVSYSSAGTISMPYARAVLTSGPGVPTQQASQIVYPSLLPTLRQAQGQLMAEALRRTGNNQSLAAKFLGITRQALNKRVHKELVLERKKRA